MLGGFLLSGGGVVVKLMIYDFVVVVDGVDFG